MPGLYGITGNTTVSVYNTTGLYNVGNGNVIVGNVNSANTTGLYQAFGNPVILNSAQTLYTLLSESGNVNFALTNSNTQVLAYFTGATNTYSNANVAAFMPTYLPSYSGNVNATYFTGNGYYLTGIVSSGGTNYSNANVAAYLPIYSGNVSAAYVLTNNIYYANGTPYVFGSTYSNANVTAYLPADPTIQAIQANVTAANTAIAGVQANLTSFETYANTHFGTSSYSNANVTAYLAAGTDPTILGIDANVAAANAAIATVQTNLTAFETASNANVGAIYTHVNTLDANLGAFEIYANATFGTSNYGNANVATYLPTYTGNIGGNITVGNYLFVAGNVQGYANQDLQLSSHANVNIITGDPYQWTFDNTGNLILPGGAIVSTTATNALSANIGAYETYANTQIASTNANVTAANAAIVTVQSNLTAFETASNANIGTLYLGNIGTQANLGAFQTYSNANVGAIYTHLGTLDANVGAYETWANSYFGTSNYSNANVAAYLAAGTDPTILGIDANVTAANTAIVSVQANLTAFETASNANVGAIYTHLGTLDANVGAFETYANANIGSIYTHLNTLDANVGAYEVYANTQISTITANLGTLYLGNISTQANLGAFETYANARFTTDNANITAANTAIATLNANVGAYEIYANANIGTLYLGNIATQANLGAFQIYSNANVGAIYTHLNTLDANVGAFETYANANFISGNIISTAPVTIQSNIATGPGIVNINAYSGQITDSGIITLTAHNIELAAYNGVQIDGGSLIVNAQSIQLNGNTTVANITAATGITANYFYGNGSQLTGIVSNYGNTQVAAFIDNGLNPAWFTTLRADGAVSLTNNVTVGGSGTIAAGTPALWVNAGDLLVRGNTQSGNLTVQNTVIANNVIANANIKSGNIAVTSTVSGAAFTYANGVNILSNVQGIYGNANVATFLPVWLNGNVTTLASPYNQNIVLTANGNAATLSSITLDSNIADANGYMSLLSTNYITLLTGNINLVTSGQSYNTINLQNYLGSTNLYTANINVRGSGTASNVFMLANVNINSAADGSGGYIKVANTATVGNLITTSGVFWANGVAYSTGGGIYGNTQVAAYLLTNTGNIQANLFTATDGLFLTNSNIGAFSYGTLSYADVDIFASYSTSQNNYAQLIMQNTNAGGSASTDFIVSNDRGNATAFYGDFGINSSGFNTGTGSLGLPNATYVYGQNSDLVLGTTTANAIHFVTNTGATDAATIYANNVSAFSNIITTNGVYWANGVAYSTGNGGGGSGSSISNGASNVSIASSGANVLIFANTGIIDAHLTTGAFILPTGGNSARPSANISGMIRYNTSTGNPEWFSSNANVWYNFSTSYTPPAGTYTMSYVIVAGGAAGGLSGGGGGGAGGFISGTAPLTVGTTYTALVGGGAPTPASSPQAVGGPGAPSSFTGISPAAVGGGGGGFSSTAGVSGGSGGGGQNTGGSGTAGQGNNGGSGYTSTPYVAGGGGGANAVGVNGISSKGGNGGAGKANPITGSTIGQLCGPTYYLAGGGGGGGYNGAAAGSGGLGGGGAAGGPGGTCANGYAGTVNTGGGGGAGIYNNGHGGAGGSGVVIISVPTSNYSGTYTGGANVSVTTSGSNTIISFTGSGTYTA